MMQFFRFIFIFLLILLPMVNSLSASTKNDVNSENPVEKLKIISFDSLCGKTITESQFLLESPKYPETYPPNSNCELTFKGGNCPTYYKLRFIDFNLEKSNGCVNDRLEIDLVDALCGEKNGTKTYLAKNGTLKLRFKTNGQISARGYKILVTKIEECEEAPESTQKTLKNNVSEPRNVDSNLKECCRNEFQKSKHFTMRSPNFPASMSYPQDCILQIHKATPDVCRLRIIFHFFWFGNSKDCTEGFIQIDGKLICGCRKHMKLISSFDENLKVIRFRSGGLVKNSYSGFLAEVFQDDCPKKVRTDLVGISNKTTLELPKENQDLKFNSPFTERPFQDYIYTQPFSSGKDREENDFLATEDINGVLVNDVSDFDSCLMWNQAQFNEIFYGKEIKIEKCQSEETRIDMEKKCTQFVDRRGFLFSPGYPFFYPGHLKICYRFSKFPGACGVRLHFFDFRIDHSELCSQDRLLVENRAYCGVELWNKIAYLDFRNRDFVDFDFITTKPKCAQGFKAYYEYLPCEKITTETPFPPPITKILPVPPPTTQRPSHKCGGVIRKEIFNLSNREGNPECVFIIEKFDEDVCQLVLNFEQLSIDCSVEVIKINGQPYCGVQTGREVTVDRKAFPVEVVYSKVGYTMHTNSFTIRGIQDTTSCLIPEPPAQLS